MQPFGEGKKDLKLHNECSLANRFESGIILKILIALRRRVNQKSNSKLVWGDEFDYAGMPDPAKWDYEEGFVRNRELQFYTDRREKNARVEDGMLL